jgi:hypothetical protein
MHFPFTLLIPQLNTHGQQRTELAIMPCWRCSPANTEHATFVRTVHYPASFNNIMSDRIYLRARLPVEVLELCLNSVFVGKFGVVI